MSRRRERTVEVEKGLKVKRARGDARRQIVKRCQWFWVDTDVHPDRGGSCAQGRRGKDDRLSQASVGSGIDSIDSVLTY